MAMSQGHESLHTFDSYQLLVARDPPLPADERICIICLGEMRHGEALRYTSCIHLYHYECIWPLVVSSTIGSDWVEAGVGYGSPEWARCPACRTPLALLDVTMHPGDAGDILDIRGKCAPPAPAPRAKKPPPPLPPRSRNLDRVQSAMQDILDHTSNVRDITQAVVAARAKAGEAASQATAAAYAYQLQRASAAATLAASSSSMATMSGDPHRPPPRPKPKAPLLPLTGGTALAQQDAPTTVIAKVGNWEAKSKASSITLPQPSPARHPQLGGAAPARVLIRVRELPSRVFDAVVHVLEHVPRIDARIWQRFDNPHVASFAHGPSPTWATFSGNTVLVCHGDVWYMRSGTEITEEIRAAITYADGEIELMD